MRFFIDCILLSFEKVVEILLQIPCQKKAVTSKNFMSRSNKTLHTSFGFPTIRLMFRTLADRINTTEYVVTDHRKMVFGKHAGNCSIRSHKEVHQPRAKSNSSENGFAASHHDSYA